MCIDVYIVPLSLAGVRGYKYAAVYGGKTLTHSFDPEHAACRELLKQGLKGKVRFWREGKAAHNLEMDIERGARFTTGDTHTRLITRRWVAFKGLGAGPEEGGGSAREQG